MRVSLFIAQRYFFSRKKKNFINTISWLSILSVSFCTAALIIVLSVFNGFNDLLHTLYASFDPDLKIEPKKGKSFEVTPALISKINSIPGVEIVTEAIQDYAYVRYKDADMVVIFKGLGDNFIEQKKLDKYLTKGDLKFAKEGIRYALVGRGIQHMLSIDIDDPTHGLQVFYVKQPTSSMLNLSGMYTKKTIRVGGVFSIEKNHDENYILLPLSFAKQLSGYRNRRTALEIKTTPSEDVEDIKKAVKVVVGKPFKVLTQEEQQSDLYRLLKIEKLFVFLSLSLLILIGSINIFFLLMMLALDKKKDLAILTAMGVGKRMIHYIFLLEGAIISFFGAGTGLIIGGIICWLQAEVGLVGLGVENAVIKNYPIAMVWSDFASVGGIVAMITMLVSFYPALLASKSYSTQYL